MEWKASEYVNVGQMFMLAKENQKEEHSRRTKLTMMAYGKQSYIWKYKTSPNISNCVMTKNLNISEKDNLRKQIIG